MHKTQTPRVDKNNEQIILTKRIETDFQGKNLGLTHSGLFLLNAWNIKENENITLDKN